MAGKSNEGKSEMSLEQAKVSSVTSDERREKSGILTENARSLGSATVLFRGLSTKLPILFVFMFASISVHVQGLYLQTEQLKNEASDSTFVSSKVENGASLSVTQGFNLPKFLWNNSRTERLRNDAYKSKFVSGITNGTLDPNYYGSYFVQDAWWVYEVGKLWGNVSRSTSDANLRKFAGDKERSWVSYGQEMFKLFSIPINATCAIPGKSANDYLNYIAQSIKTQPAYMLITSYPCAKLWNDWQTRCSQIGSRVHNVYFEYWCIAGKPPTPQEQLIQNFYDGGVYGNNTADLLNTFITGMQHEVSFFNGAAPAKP